MQIREDSKRGAVVDPGGDLDRIAEAIAKIDLRIEKILLTHGHIDHAGGAADLAAQPGAIPVEGPHRADKFLLDGLAAQGKALGLSDAKSVTPDRWLAEGETVTAAGVTFAVLHCPGHSPGSVVLVNDANRFALVGDAGLHKDPTPGLGITDALRDARGLARAILAGKYHVDFDDVKNLAGPVLRHRLVPNFHARADGVDADAIVGRLVETVKQEA